MTDFVISEDELIGAEIGELELCESVHIRSRPLSDELTDAYRNGYIDGQSKAAVENERNNNGRLKAERKRVLDKYLELLVSCRFELDGEIVVKMSAIRNVREELRGEP